MTEKEKYRIWSNNQLELPIFMHDWWLDAASLPFKWDVVLIENKSEILATLPFVIRKKFGFTLIRTPFLTPFSNIWIQFPKDLSPQKKLSYEKEIIYQLINKLPSFSHLQIRLNPQINYSLPFVWKGFQSNIRYTNRLNDTTSIEKLYSFFKPSLKRNISKAQKIVSVSDTNDIKAFYSLFKMTFNRQNKKAPYTLNTLSQIDTACDKKNARKIILAKDEEGNIHAGIYLVWDNQYVYYLMGGSNPKFRNSQALSLLMWHAIQFASKQKKSFDFEGSMIEPVERFFRSFGAKPTPYFEISKSNSSLLKIYQFLTST